MTKSSHRLWLAFALLGAGLLMVTWGFAAQGRPRTDFEDYKAWCIWGVGISLTAAGVCIFFARLARPAVVIPLAIVSPFAAFVLLVIVFWGWIVLSALLSPGSLARVSSGYPLIPEARQIDDLFGPAWHFAVNYREPNKVEWFTEAAIGGRYELTMFVPVEFDSGTGYILRVTGKPRFFLREVTRVQGRGVSYGRQYEFSPEEWKNVVAADGDFSVIGLALDLNNPVAGFAKYQDRPRNGLQLKSEKNQGSVE